MSTKHETAVQAVLANVEHLTLDELERVQQALNSRRSFLNGEVLSTFRAGDRVWIKTEKRGLWGRTGTVKWPNSKTVTIVLDGGNDEVWRVPPTMLEHERS